MRASFLLAGLAGLAALAGPAAAQSNTVSGLDVSLGVLGGMSTLGRTGTFPTGLNGLAMSTTSCNDGTVDVAWMAAMDEDHPFIAFMLVRESNGRMEQISNRSWVKHGFFALSSSQCTPCQNPTNGDYLGVGCSDTYGAGTNGDRFWLGPPSEINPWLGTWTALGSFFDCPTSSGCDSVRSYNGGEPNSVNHRVEVLDADLNVPGNFYYQAHYVIAREAEVERDDNIGWRPFTPSWNGSSWNIATGGGSVTHGTVLDQWQGATVSSVANSGQDGRLYLAALVTQTGPETWHYEYALYNRDNNRGGGALRIPLAPGTVVTNPGFHDLDGNPLNDWAYSLSSNEVAWSSIFLPLNWNTLYNFWFDANVPPASGMPVGIGLFQTTQILTTTNVAPGDPGVVATYCQGKLNSVGCVPYLSSTGSPSATATAPFRIEANDLVPDEVGFYVYGLNGRSNLSFHNGTLCVKAPFERLLPAKISGSGQTPPCSGQIAVNFNNRIQSGADPLLTVGQTVNAQLRQRDPLLGDGFNDSLTDGIEFLIQP